MTDHKDGKGPVTTPGQSKVQQSDTAAAIVRPALDEPKRTGDTPSVPLWLAKGYRLAPPGPSTPEERKAAARAARARLRASRTHRRAVEICDIEIGTEAHSPRVPATFGMSDQARVAYGRYLMEVEGWAPEEVRAVLVPPRTAVHA